MGRGVLPVHTGRKNPSEGELYERHLAAGPRVDASPLDELRMEAHNAGGRDPSWLDAMFSAHMPITVLHRFDPGPVSATLTSGTARTRLRGGPASLPSRPGGPRGSDGRLAAGPAGPELRTADLPVEGTALRSVSLGDDYAVDPTGQFLTPTSLPACAQEQAETTERKIN